MKSYLLALTFLFPLFAGAEPVKYADSSTIKSSAFGESREIMVSLPPSYAKSSSTRYPVIYTVRGQLDLLAVVAAINMLDSEAPEFIVVGITGSGAEFIPDEKFGETKFSRLLHSDVVPHIEKNYRTAPYSILVGHSAAGKFVTNDWLSRGDDFSSYYAISPELNDGVINARVKSMSEKSVSLKNSLLISMGNESERMQSMFDELKARKALSKNTRFVQFKDQTHMSGRVHTVIAGLRDSFKNWRPSSKVASGSLEGLQAHYSALSERYGYEVLIPLETMKRESAFHSASKIEERWHVASDIVKYALAKTPNDVDEFISIADELSDYGAIEGSQRLISFVCEQAPGHSRCANIAK